MKTNLPPPNYHQLQENGAGEFLLINRLIKHLAQPPFSHPNLGPTKERPSEKGKSFSGIGDDCAIIPSSIVGKYQLLSVDSFIEGRHFLFNISTPEEIGYKAVATAVSDIAAMGGTPRFLLINLHLARDFNAAVIENIYCGIQEFCSKYETFVIGGNTSSSDETSISVTVIGDSDALPLLRNGAKEGEDFWVSGALGLSQLGLSMLKDKKQYELSKSILASAISRYQRPEPRISLGQKVLELGATSAIDISDGIFQDAGHIALQSGLEVELDLASLNQLGLSEADLVSTLSAGGDYELLFSAPSDLRNKIADLNKELSSDCQLVRCGRAVKANPTGLIVIKTKEGVFSSLELAGKYNLAVLGNDHFAKNTAI